MPNNGSATISGVAILENPRAVDPSKPKTLLFDAFFYLDRENEKCELKPLVALLRYFNGSTPTGPPYDFTGTSICYVNATVSIF